MFLSFKPFQLLPNTLKLSCSVYQILLLVFLCLQNLLFLALQFVNFTKYSETFILNAPNFYFCLIDVCRIFLVFKTFSDAEKLQNVPVIQTFIKFSKLKEIFMRSIPNSHLYLFDAWREYCFTMAILGIYFIFKCSKTEECNCHS